MREAGATINDRFRLIEKLGEGGMGVTWKAVDEQLGDEVVIKFLKIADAKDWKTVELFEREIDVLRCLDHPSIPDLVWGNADADGDWFLVQELAPGESIQGLIDRKSRFDEAILRGVADQVLDTLVYLQERSPPIVHRDIKPDNLVIDTDGSVRLVDFGAASLALTDTKLGGSTVVGTFGYMAPEQFRGISRAGTDLYGLGMTLIVMATGVAPERLETVGLKIQFEEQSTLSGPFTQWLKRMVEPDVDKRFESAAVALDRLRNLGAEAPEDSLPTRTNADYLTKLHAFSQLKFASLKIKRSKSGVDMIYRRKSFRAALVVFTLVGFIMTLATFVASFVDFGVAIFLSIFAITFGGMGLNGLIYKEHLRFQDDGRWAWKTRGLLGSKTHNGTTGDIVRFDAAQTGTKINNESLYQVTMNSYHGDYRLFTGLRYGEAIGIARELGAVTGAEPAPDRRAVRHHAILAFDEALRTAANKGGILGGLAKAARQTPALQRTLSEVNQHPSSQHAGPRTEATPTNKSVENANRRSIQSSRAAVEPAATEKHQSRSYVFEPKDYEER